MKGPELTPFHFCCWLLLSLAFHLGHGRSSTWIDLTDFDSIYNEIGFKDHQSDSLETPENSDHCTLTVSNFSRPNDAFRVMCHTVQKCQISSFSQPQNRPNTGVVNVTSSVVDLWNGCTYENGDKLFKSDHLSLVHLNSTVIQLMFGGNRMTAFPDQYFCGLSNLTRLDLSKNKLDDLSTLGLTAGCAINENDTNCCGCSLKELILEANEFEIVSNDSFCGLPNLIVLRMSRCRVEDIGVHAFRGLDNLKYLDLSRNKLPKLFDGTFEANPRLRILYLSHNQLDKSSLSALRPLRDIRHLYLDGNQIEAVDDGAFSSFTHLKVLILNDNLLNRLEPGQLSQLSNLRELDLGFNGLTEIGESTLIGITDATTLDLSDNYLSSIEPGAFGNCLNLTTLRLSNNRFTRVPSEINSLSMLKHLYMDRNEIKTLSATDLVNLTNLIDLDLSENQLTTVERGMFDRMTSLVTLKLSGNKLTNINRCFTSANIVNLFLDRNQITNFSFDDYSSNTKYLSIFGNNITSFGSVDSSRLVSSDQFKQQELNLGCNQLRNLSDLLLPAFVRKFNLQSNRIQSITYDTNFTKALDNANVKLNSVRLQNNAFGEICHSNVITSKSSTKVENYFVGNPLMCSCENAWLLNAADPKYSGIKDILDLDCTTMLSRPGIAPVPTKIRDLSADSFLCKSEAQTKDLRCKCDSSRNCSVLCPRGCRCYSSSNFAVVYIDCGHSGHQTVPRSVDYSKISKTILYLDGNDIHNLNASGFVPFPNTITLYLNRSHIAYIDVGTFDSLKGLQELHLEDNELQTLPAGIFKTQINLIKLFLQDNDIDTLANDVFLPLKSLETINVSSNYLTNYSVWELDKLGTLTSLDLRDNRWSCTCDFMKNFSDFLRNNSGGKLAAGEELFCTETNNTVADQPIEDYYYYNCYSSLHTYVTNVSTITYIWASLLGIFVCVTIIALILFYFRQEMQVLFYSHYGVRIFTRNRSRTADEDGKIYDAFIAYSSEDEEFLVYKLLPGLENIDRPYRLCLHQRDFAPGAFITDSILEAVERSSRTIILLSENFIKSEWCKFEFKTAHVQMLHDRCARVLVVVMGEIPTGVDPEMKLYLKTNTYLKWGEKLFWEKLYFALPERKDEPKEQVEMIPRIGPD